MEVIPTKSILRIVQIALYGNANKEIREHLQASFESWQTAELDCSPQMEAEDWFAMADLYAAAQEFTRNNFSI
jgi:hypothetical protein